MTGETESVVYIPTDEEVAEADDATKKFKEEWIRKNSEFNKGQRRTEEAKKKMSEAQKGNKNNLGKPRSEEAIRKAAEKNRGKHHSEESKKKMSKTKKVKYANMSSEERRKILGHNVGITWNIGKHRSEESKRKMREAHANRKKVWESSGEKSIQHGLTNLGKVWGKHRIIKELLPLQYKYHKFDIVLENEKIIIEHQGCHFHACKLCGVVPKFKYQFEEIELDNVIRESIRRQTEWKLIGIWEHDVKSDMTIEYLLRKEIPELFEVK